MTREGIEKQMDNLARKYVETHDPEILGPAVRAVPTVEAKKKS